jgi:hypothetical protein
VSTQRHTVAEVEDPNVVEELVVLLTSEDEEEIVVHADGVTVPAERHLPPLRAFVDAVCSDARPVVRRYQSQRRTDGEEGESAFRSAAVSSIRSLRLTHVQQIQPLIVHILRVLLRISTPSDHDVPNTGRRMSDSRHGDISPRRDGYDSERTTVEVEEV